MWDTLTAIGGASIQTRSGNTPTPDGSWSAFQSLGGGGAIQSPPGRYIQYQATLDAATRTTLDRVAIGYDIDSVAPDAAITGVQVSGTTATVSFGSAAGDLARFECSLDHGAYAACSSPKQFTGLAAGSHVVSVRAIDRAGNVGPAAESAFRVDSPSGGSARADRTAPKVTLTLLSSRASKSGAVTLRLGCPATESRCKVKVALKLGHKTVASTTTSIAGGKTKKVTLRLSKSARRQLARRKRLKVKAVISATDAAGNRSTRTVGLALRAQRH